MADPILNCPRCERPLRVGPALQGKPVKCPACGMVFQAGSEVQDALPAGEPIPTVEPRFEPASLDSGSLEPLPDERHDHRPLAASDGSLTHLRLVAGGLLICGLLGMAINAFQAGMVASGFYPPKAESVPPFMREMVAQTSPQQIYTNSAIFFAMSLITVVAAACMFARKLYPIAFVGSILAMVNIGNCCCLIGLPIGIWTIVVMCKPDVKRLFG